MTFEVVRESHKLGFALIPTIEGAPGGYVFAINAILPGGSSQWTFTEEGLARLIETMREFQLTLRAVNRGSQTAEKELYK